MGLGKMMDLSVMFILTTTTLLLLSYSPSAYSQPDLTKILSTPGFESFLSILQSSNALQVMQAQANTQQGLTLFCPSDAAIAHDNVSWGSLSAAQTLSLMLFHALPQYYGKTATGLAALTKLTNAVTMAGSQYTLDVTDGGDYAHVKTGWTDAVVLTAVDQAPYPTVVYQIDHVLKPEALFGTNIPPPPPPSTTSSTTPSPPPSSTNSTLSPPVAAAAAASNSTPSMTTVTVPPITITHSAADSFRMVGLGGWARIVLGVSGGSGIFLLL